MPFDTHNGKDAMQDVPATPQDAVNTALAHPVTQQALTQVLAGGTESTVAFLLIALVCLLVTTGYVYRQSNMELKNQLEAKAQRIADLEGQLATANEKMLTSQRDAHEALLRAMQNERDSFDRLIAGLQQELATATEKSSIIHSRDLKDIEQAIRVVEQVMLSMRDLLIQQQAIGLLNPRRGQHDQH